MKGLKQNSHLVNEIPQYSLTNIENYKHTLQCSMQDILTKFVSVIIEYMKFMSEKIKMKNKHYYKFVFERGIATIIHVFTNILYYTKNIDLTFYHSQKAYYVYIEFIEQISDDNITFLQLTSRDAILFVYKKTIFEINQDYKKNMIELTNDDKNILTHFDIYITIYKNIISFLISNSDFNYKNNIEQHINTCCDKIKTISDELNKIKFKKNYLDCIYLFTNLLIDKEITISLFFSFIFDFIKRLQSRKKIIDEKCVRQNIYLKLTNADVDLNDDIIDQIFME
jgi:hypothetical protein